MPELENYERQFLVALPIIDDLVAALCRSNRLPDGDWDNFRSLVIVKVIENDYRVLRQFRGQCNLRSYLLVVFRRVLLDYRSQRWGKWRPSLAAKRQGKLAMQLEELVARDGLTFREAVAALRTNFGVADSTAVLQDIVVQLPVRQRLHVECTDTLPEIADDAPLPDAVVAQDESRADAARVKRQLRDALRVLSCEERRILKMRYLDAMPVVEIARVLDCDPKMLYRRIERILLRARKLMHQNGVTKHDAQSFALAG
jgi:RNA polymerase sigma factor (sigma-70 family)